MASSSSDFICFLQAQLASHQIELGPDDDLLGGGLVDSMIMMSLIDAAQRESGRMLPTESLVPENFASLRVMAETFFREEAAAE